MFVKDAQVYHSRTGKLIQLAQPKKLFGSQRESIDEAFPGDVIGLTNPGLFLIGDTVSAERNLALPPIPTFAPEMFAGLRNNKPSKYKGFHKGIKALQEEGAIQIFQDANQMSSNPILAAVGALQFEVVQYRLESEYDVDTTLEPLPYTIARWVVGGWDVLDKDSRWGDNTVVMDLLEEPVILFKSDWTFKRFQEKFPDIELSKTSYHTGVDSAN
jgi:peptide chain release factor 3